MIRLEKKPEKSNSYGSDLYAHYRDVVIGTGDSSVPSRRFIASRAEIGRPTK